MVDQKRLELRAGHARLTVSPSEGGRFSSLVVDGQEVLLTEGFGPIRWGCYPMVPFAGRIRDGRFTFRGRTIQLPLNLPPHAIHGTALERAWGVVSAEPERVVMAIDLGPDWPFAGQVTHAIALRADGLEATLTLEAGDPMPASLGWHPWFRRQLVGTPERPRPSSTPADLTFAAARMHVRGPDGLPTGVTTAPGPPPWDDAFSGLLVPPRVTWPGELALELTSTADVWVVYDEAVEGICVEPQTAPPDVVNLAAARGEEPPVATPDRPMTATMAWRWTHA